MSEQFVLVEFKGSARLTIEQAQNLKADLEAGKRTLRIGEVDLTEITATIVQPEEE